MSDKPEAHHQYVLDKHGYNQVHAGKHQHIYEHPEHGHTVFVDSHNGSWMHSSREGVTHSKPFGDHRETLDAHLRKTHGDPGVAGVNRAQGRDMERALGPIKPSQHSEQEETTEEGHVSPERANELVKETPGGWLRNPSAGH